MLSESVPEPLYRRLSGIARLYDEIPTKLSSQFRIADGLRETRHLADTHASIQISRSRDDGISKLVYRMLICSEDAVEQPRLADSSSRDCYYWRHCRSLL